MCHSPRCDTWVLCTLSVLGGSGTRVFYAQPKRYLLLVFLAQFIHRDCSHRVPISCRVRLKSRRTMFDGPNLPARRCIVAGQELLSHLLLTHWLQLVGFPTFEPSVVVLCLLDCDGDTVVDDCCGIGPEICAFTIWELGRVSSKTFYIGWTRHKNHRHAISIPWNEHDTKNKHLTHKTLATGRYLYVVQGINCR